MKKDISELTMCDICNAPNLGYGCTGCPFTEEENYADKMP